MCGDAIDVVGIPGVDVSDLSAAQQAALGVHHADGGRTLFEDATLRRKPGADTGGRPRPPGATTPVLRGLDLELRML